MTTFAWDIINTDTDLVSNGSFAGHIEDSSIMEGVFTYSSAALLFLMAVTAWRTVGTKTSELLQFIWSFGIMWGGAQLLSDIPMAADIVAVKSLAYDVVGWGTLYHVLPQAVTSLIMPQINKLPVPTVATHALTLAAQVLPTLGFLSSVVGSSHFTADQLSHMPLAVIAVVYGTYTILGMLKIADQGAPSTLTLSTAISSTVAFIVFEMHAEEAISDLWCALMMPVAGLAFYTVAIQQEMKLGVNVVYVAGLPWLPALPGSALIRASENLEQVQTSAKRELGFAAP